VEEFGEALSVVSGGMMTMTTSVAVQGATLTRVCAARKARVVCETWEAADEAEIVWQARHGSRDAFGQLYARHHATIARYVATRVRNPAESEDITEAIFESAWRAVGRYKEQGVPFLAWLYRLAHNRVIDHYRAQRPTLSLIPEVHESLVDGDNSLENNVNGADLIEALGLLTDEQRQVILMRFVYGLNGREVAQAMDKREDAVRALQFRALATLRRILTDESPPAREAEAG